MVYFTDIGLSVQTLLIYKVVLANKLKTNEA